MAICNRCCASVLTTILLISTAVEAEESRGCPTYSYVAVSEQDDSVFASQGLKVGGPRHSGDWHQGFIRLKRMFPDIEMRYMALGESELPAALLRDVIDIAVTTCDRLMTDPEDFFSRFDGLNVWVLALDEEPRVTTLAQYDTEEEPSDDAYILHLPTADWRLEDRSLVSDGFDTYFVLECENPGELLMIGGGEAVLRVESLPSDDEGKPVSVGSFVNIDYMDEGLKITSTVENRPALLFLNSDFVTMIVYLNMEDFDKFVGSRAVLVTPTIFRESKAGPKLDPELMKAAGAISYQYAASSRPLEEAMGKEFRALCFE